MRKQAEQERKEGMNFSSFSSLFFTLFSLCPLPLPLLFFDLDISLPFPFAFLSQAEEQKKREKEEAFRMKAIEEARQAAEVPLLPFFSSLFLISSPSPTLIR